jgi:hypothetical protein
VIPTQANGVSKLSAQWNLSAGSFSTYYQKVFDECALSAGWLLPQKELTPVYARCWIGSRIPLSKKKRRSLCFAQIATCQ